MFMVRAANGFPLNFTRTKENSITAGADVVRMDDVLNDSGQCFLFYTRLANLEGFIVWQQIIRRQQITLR